MIRINPLTLSIHHDEAALLKKASKMMRIEISSIKSHKIIRRSIDAREKSNIIYSYMIDFEIDDEQHLLKLNTDKKITKAEKSSYKMPIPISLGSSKKPVIVGFGPAGMFAGLLLARSGSRPIILERGDDVDSRSNKVGKFWSEGLLDTESNVSFGEGGAGTFSDGKLNTLVKDNNGRNRFVLETLVEFGADADILYDQKPHIGTDKLKKIVKNIRLEIIKLGGDVRFNTKLAGIVTDHEKLTSIKLSDGSSIECDKMILAIGHSARDTITELFNSNLKMEAKSFAVGVRIQHPQHMIDVSQFGEKEADFLSPATYKLTAKAKNGRGVYSFCMCPGGYVINAASEDGCLSVNGMSYHNRASKSANSAIIVSVDPKDYGSDTPLAGIEYQRSLEKAAFKSAHGNIPVQLLGDFMKGKLSTEYGDVDACFMGRTEFARLDTLLPTYISEAIIDTINEFDRKIHGFARPDAIVAGIESRTSSPVRIVRNDDCMSNISGIYPCGEGSGYAGGITSASMDGIKTAEKIIALYHKEYLTD